jgi:hypothetical protein
MGTEEDRDYDSAARGYGAVDPEVDEDTPAQEQQRPEHERGESGDAVTDPGQFEEPGPGRGGD